MNRQEKLLYRKIYERYKKLVYRSIVKKLGCTGEPANAIFQEVFIELAVSFSSVNTKGEEYIEAWLFVTAKRVCSIPNVPRRREKFFDIDIT